MKKTILFLAIAVTIDGCGVRHKMNSLRGSNIYADISLAVQNSAPPEYEIDEAEESPHVIDSVQVGPIIMNAVKDENGEMTATDVIKAAMVTARFRNIAERHGKVDLEFQVNVPEELLDSRWQLRLNPDMFIMDDSVRLDPVVITGMDYRKKQLRGYEQYRKFLDSIISDPDKLLNKAQLEIFIKRNIPEIYRFRSDTSFVSDETFASAYGVTEKAAIEHYTKKYLVLSNERKKAKKDKMYSRYVKAPIVTEGIRLDTVIISPEGEFIYNYIQTINTCPGLRKAEIKLSGEILEAGETAFRVPESRPLTFYISSLSTLADQSEKYLMKVIPRRVEANTACYVEFPSGRHDILPELGNNRDEISRIKKNLCDLVSDNEFDLDSIIVTASCSPEGQKKYNEDLSRRRASSISGYFNDFLKHCRDSIRREEGAVLHIGETGGEYTKRGKEVRFISRTTGENWTMLDSMIGRDTVLTASEKEKYMDIRNEPDIDKREQKLSQTPFYRYLRETLYPRLRTVRFDFHLHRKGMLLDTVRTTVLDTAYMSGVRAITDRDYRKAINILRPYGDYNLAVAYCAMDYNTSALQILEKLPETDKTLYMLAIIYSRTGRTKDAVNAYKKACSMNQALVHRGNLDPEISSLIKSYKLNGYNGL
ncbi:MAG: hypothetical protein ACI3ZO_04875 [Candidatus Cryptobacteroides sp.]|nr:hypothetical protein [Bacteroidales bacterium]